MNPRLRAICVEQRGVFTRRQAVACGCTERELKTRTGSLGDWAVVRRGVYAERALWDAMGPDDRYRLRVRAAVLTAGKAAAVSHTSAAAILGLPMSPHWMGLVHLTRPGVTGSRTEGGVKHHLAGLDEGDVVEVDGLRATCLERTAVDVAREHGFTDGVIAADAALRHGAKRDQMELVVHRMRCWPHVTRARHAVAVADGGSQSVGETLLRLVVLELDVGEPETQFVAVDRGRRAEVDLRVGRHLFEFDGKVKYLGREQGGVADERPEQVLWREKQREDWLRNHDGGYGMSRVIWSELLGRARDETKRRLAHEVAESQRRYSHLG